MNMRRTIPIALIAMLPFAAVACGGDDDSAGDSTTPAGTDPGTTPASDAPDTTGGDTATTGDSPATTAGSATTDGGSEDTSGGGGGGDITVGDGGFPESQILAQIYGQALEAEGYSVSYETFTDRGAYYPAIEAGDIDLVPEYTGSLLFFLDDAATAGNVEEQVTALGETLPDGLAILTPSAAEDKDTIVCTQAAVDEHSLTDLNSLFAVAGEITIGAPPEFQDRTPFGIKGFEENNDATFAEFIPLDSGAIADALVAEQIDCGNLFSTNPQIAAEGFVALDDSDAIVSNEAIVPLVRTDAIDEAAQAILDEIDATLTTENVTELVGKVAIDAQGADVVAEEYLASL